MNLQSKIKYLCLLGHKDNPDIRDYGKWQRQIIRKYDLWSLSRIEEWQMDQEIAILEKKLSHL